MHFFRVGHFRSYFNGMSVNTIYIVGYIINDVLVSNGQFTIVNVGTN